MFRKDFFIIWVLISITHLSIEAQVLKGVIRDSDRNPIIDAHIVNLRNKDHVHTDEKGRFELLGATIGDSLKCTFIGYQPKNIILAELDRPLDIMLRARSISLNKVVILPTLNALNVITKLDIQSNPVRSSQEVLMQIPGLFIGQHAGGGKAEQIFLRGFDIDHGTDIAITVDGLPVNMVSHAHGQGYADLHFLIPETITNIDFGKGPYYSSHGNLNTAGYIDFKTKDKLNNSTLKLEYGQFQTKRILGMIDVGGSDDSAISSYIATEFLSSDGPFESPQNFNRINIMAKINGRLSQSENVSMTMSHFASTWDASGQIPQRAVDSGLISRFGAIDDTEGGTTSRTNILFNHRKFFNNSSYITNKLFYSRYAFELYSNFTFFLEDSINGDQIRQNETRDIFGLKSAYIQEFDLGAWDGQFETGIELRSDRIEDNELSSSLNRRTTLKNIQLGDVAETNISNYIDGRFNFGRWSFNTGLRFDHFDFQYKDALVTTYSNQVVRKSIISPKLNVLYNCSNNLQLYVKTGKGFHSNDTRVIVSEDGTEILPAAYGTDVGFIWKPWSNMLVNTAYWYLYSEQEFVYVGDAGIVEPSGAAVRHGLDLSIRYQPWSWLYWNLNANVTDPRSAEAETGIDYIPLAPTTTLMSGLQLNNDRFYGGIRVRYIGDRPANEDYSIVAEGYTIYSMNMGYKIQNFDFGIQIDNLFDVEWKETQFATESRLANEASSVEEIHFTPGTPFFLKCSIEYSF
jgi:outer membrane receptor for Fe3+-dicitrate